MPNVPTSVTFKGLFYSLLSLSSNLPAKFVWPFHNRTCRDAIRQSNPPCIPPSAMPFFAPQESKSMDWIGACLWPCLPSHYWSSWQCGITCQSHPVTTSLTAMWSRWKKRWRRSPKTTASQCPKGSWTHAPLWRTRRVHSPQNHDTGKLWLANTQSSRYWTSWRCCLRTLNIYTWHC